MERDDDRAWTNWSGTPEMSQLHPAVTRDSCDMRPGDPFETDELDELRAEQRRVLAWIPRWIMERIENEDDQGIGEPTLENDSDRPQCELVLRRYVRDKVLEGEEDLIEKMRCSTEGEMLEAAFAPIALGWNNDLASDARASVSGS